MFQNDKFMFKNFSIVPRWVIFLIDIGATLFSFLLAIAIRQNLTDEWKERGDVWSFQAMLDNPELEGQRPMPDSIVTVAKFLQSKGYKTGMVGKYH